MQISPRDRSLTLVGVLLAVFLGALDQTIVATDLPKLVEDLQGVSRYAWVATAYLLASTVAEAVRAGIADAVTATVGALVWVVAAVLGVTRVVPALELWRTNEPVAAAN